jgi:hypothetical protein
MAKTNKLSQLNQTDGRTEETPRTLSQFFGETIQGKYSTNEENEYLSYLNTLNKTDLQRHAIKCGLTPKDDRNRLVQSLVREFKRVVASYKPLPVIKQKPISKETLQVLAQGR